MNTMTAVAGKNRQGARTVLSVGDTISGYTYGGKLVTGTVVSTDRGPYEFTIEGITGFGDPRIVRGRFTVQMRDVLTHVRRSPATA